MSGDVHRPESPTGSIYAARSAPPSAWSNRHGGAGRLRIPRFLTGRDVPALYIARSDTRSAPGASPLPTGVIPEMTSRSLCLGRYQGKPDSFLAPSRPPGGIGPPQEAREPV